MKDGHCGVEVCEKEVGAFLDQLVRQQTRSRGKSLAGIRAADTVHSILDLGVEAARLSLAQFADDLGPGALGALLLRNSIVCARQLRGRAVTTRVDAIAFDLSAMAGIARPLHGRRHVVEFRDRDREPSILDAAKIPGEPTSR